jgi:hypothetical protein
MGEAARARSLSFEWSGLLHDLYENYLEVLAGHEKGTSRLIC